MGTIKIVVVAQEGSNQFEEQVGPVEVSSVNRAGLMESIEDRIEMVLIDIGEELSGP